MGVVFGPEDVLKGREWMLKRAARDLSPAHLERVEQILHKWDEKSERKLIELLGEERAKRLLKDLGVL
jgi:hypothetical protein